MQAAARRRATRLEPGNPCTYDLANGFIALSIPERTFGDEHEGETR